MLELWRLVRHDSCKELMGVVEESLHVSVAWERQASGGVQRESKLKREC